MLKWTMFFNYNNYFLIIVECMCDAHIYPGLCVKTRGQYGELVFSFHPVGLGDQVRLPAVDTLSS